MMAHSKQLICSRRQLLRARVAHARKPSRPWAIGGSRSCECVGVCGLRGLNGVERRGRGNPPIKQGQRGHTAGGPAPPRSIRADFWRRRSQLARRGGLDLKSAAASIWVTDSLAPKFGERARALLLAPCSLVLRSRRRPRQANGGCGRRMQRGRIQARRTQRGGGPMGAMLRFRFRL